MATDRQRCDSHNFLKLSDDGCPIAGQECNGNSMRASYSVCLKFRFRHDLRRLPGRYDPGEFTFVREATVHQIETQIRGAFLRARTLCRTC